MSAGAPGPWISICLIFGLRLIASARSEAVWVRDVLNGTAPSGMMLNVPTVTVLTLPLAPPVRVTVPEARVSWVSAPDDAVTVPTASLVRDDEGWALFVIADGVATRRQVGVGRRGATAVQVTEGVTPGEVIVMHPSDRIAEGVAIEPL